MKLKPGEVEHDCRTCTRCGCAEAEPDDRCGSACGWDCDCPAYYQPEDQP